MRVAIYARYSSENQREASIDDQIRICKAHAAKNDWPITAVFTDQALSGATIRRPGYQALLKAVQNGEIELVLAESLDRFSRDMEHIAAFYKQCRFHGVRIDTLSEGQVSELHIGLKGTMGALYLRDLADKTKRGLEGRIREGRCTGTPPYGYTVLRHLHPSGQLDRGLRAIDAIQAATVRRVFQNYADGMSPRRIARALNSEGVPAPGGGIWYDASIRGREKRRDGILRNALYAGRLVWRRRLSLTDPNTGKCVRRDASPDSFIDVPVEHLRIVEDSLWKRVQDRLVSEAVPLSQGSAGQQATYCERRRPRHLLSGKVICGSCQRSFVPVGRDYLRCVAALNGTCTNSRSVRRGKLESWVLGILNRQLMQPDLVAEFVAAFQAEWHRLASEVAAQAQARQREVAALDRKIENLVAVLSDGRSSLAVFNKLKELENARGALGEVDDHEDLGSSTLHEGLAQAYSQRIGELTAVLNEGGDPASLELARQLIDNVIIHPPSSSGGPPEHELVGVLPELLKLGLTSHPRSPARNSRAKVDPVLALFVSSVKEGLGAEPPPSLPFLAHLHPPLAFPGRNAEIRRRGVLGTGSAVCFARLRGPLAP